MGLCVLCCGCKSVLQNDGSVLKWDPWISQPNDAVFKTVEEADAGAHNAGWECKTGGIEGNHRCPDCVNFEATDPAPAPSHHVGAFIDAAKVRPTAPDEVKGDGWIVGVFEDWFGGADKMTLDEVQRMEEKGHCKIKVPMSRKRARKVCAEHQDAGFQAIKWRCKICGLWHVQSSAPPPLYDILSKYDAG